MRKMRIFALCWITYVFAYLCRLNMSSVMTKLEKAFSAGGDKLGLIGSLFFLTYATGQLINGFIGDRISPYRFLLIGLTGTITVNLISSLCSLYWALILCWALNGYFQSMFWGPLMRVLSANYSNSRYSDISTGMSVSLVFGFIFSWVVLGGLLLNQSWRLYFLIPALCALSILPLWIFLSRRSRHRPQSGGQSAPPDFASLFATIRQHRLYLAAGVAVCMGLIKEGVSLWAPLILVKVLRFRETDSLIAVLLIPLANFGGIFFTRLLNGRLTGRIRPVLSLLFLVAGAGCVGLFFLAPLSKVAGLVSLALISAMTFGCNSILLSYLPLCFSRLNMVSSLVGILDFSSYLGAAISSFVIGLILAGADFGWILLIWLVTAGIAVCLLRPLSSLDHLTKEVSAHDNRAQQPAGN